MKTTENISLAGYAFIMETDAYESLKAYIEDIRTCFNDESCKDELIDDIEERIAELLNEKCRRGTVANLQMINEIKARIGNPEELVQEDTCNAPSTGAGQDGPQGNNQQEKKSWKSRRLYRDMEERVVGGVCSGLGAYFGLDKVLFRILFLIFLFIGFLGWYDGPYFLFSVLAYVCLWIAMPAARTVEQKCELKGKPIDLQGFRDKESGFEKEVKDIAQSPAGQTVKRAGGVFLGLLLLITGLGGLLGSILIPALPDIIQHEITEEVLDWGPLDPDEQLLADIATGDTFWIMAMVMTGLLFIWFLYNGVMLLFDLKAPSWRPGLIIFIAWIISIFAMAAWVLKTIADVLPSLLM